MDSRTFDHLTRAVYQLGSRRQLLAGIPRVLVAALPLVVAVDTARGNRPQRRRQPLHKERHDLLPERRKKRKKRRHTVSPLPPTSCRPNCTDRVCGDDGCGGSCGTCADGACEAGVCVCPRSMEWCGGACALLCASFQARNPQTCACCTVTDGGCANSDTCCSADCHATTCRGRGEGLPCQFGAQCVSGVCVTGACAAG